MTIDFRNKITKSLAGEGAFAAGERFNNARNKKGSGAGFQIGGPGPLLNSDQPQPEDRDLAGIYTPPYIEAVSAAQDELQRTKGGNYLGYGPVAGLDIIRETYASLFNAWTDLKVGPDHILKTIAKLGLELVIGSFVEENAAILAPHVSYPMFKENTIAHKGRYIGYKWKKEGTGAWKFDFGSFSEKLEEAIGINKEQGLDMLLVMINSPHNPMGNVLTVKELQDIADVLKGMEKKHKISILVCSDESYKTITFEGLYSRGEFQSMSDKDKYEIANERFMRGQPASIVQYWKTWIGIYGFSKSLAIPGERCGFLVASDPEILVGPATQQNRLISHSSRVVHGVVKQCLDNPEFRKKTLIKYYENVITFGERNEALAEGLSSIPGIEIAPADGGFFLTPDWREAAHIANGGLLGFLQQENDVTAYLKDITDICNRNLGIHCDELKTIEDLLNFIENKNRKKSKSFDQKQEKVKYSPRLGSGPDIAAALLREIPGYAIGCLAISGNFQPAEEEDKYLIRFSYSGVTKASIETACRKMREWVLTRAILVLLVPARSKI